MEGRPERLLREEISSRTCRHAHRVRLLTMESSSRGEAKLKDDLDQIYLSSIAGPGEGKVHNRQGLSGPNSRPQGGVTTQLPKHGRASKAVTGTLQYGTGTRQTLGCHRGQEVLQLGTAGKLRESTSVFNTFVFISTLSKDHPSDLYCCSNIIV